MTSETYCDNYTAANDAAGHGLPTSRPKETVRALRIFGRSLCAGRDERGLLRWLIRFENNESARG